MSKPKNYHVQLNAKGKIKQFAFNAGIVGSVATAALGFGGVQAGYETLNTLGPMIGLSLGTAVLGGVIYNAIPEKYITLTLATQTTVRVQ